jgi:hypothetical protein
MGVKSGTSDRDEIGLCRPGVGGAMFPERCFFCNARVRVRRLSLKKNISFDQVIN